MCIWAGYANTDMIEYGSSFALVVISWILFLCAGIVGNWERFDGVPETGKRLISLGAWESLHVWLFTLFRHTGMPWIVQV
jgi:hypothetical protein